jgi:hypothetical protein
MDFWRELNDGSGFVVEQLTADELASVRCMIEWQYLEQLDAIAPKVADAAAQGGIEHYHTLQLPFDHGTFWEKNRRVLGAECVGPIESMGFFRRIQMMLPSARIYQPDLMWRIVRPNQPTDVGPVHADKWFWDAGNGDIDPGWGRFKIWIAIATEPGRNGLSVKPHSHKSDRWKRHFEFRHGKQKPVLDERVEDLQMELLPLRSGEMVLFHDGLLHGGAVNGGSTCRVSVEVTVLYREDEGQRLLAKAAA